MARQALELAHLVRARRGVVPVGSDEQADLENELAWVVADQQTKREASRAERRQKVTIVPVE